MDFERKAFYSPAEVGEIVGQHPSTILRHIHEGRLRAVKLSARTYRIPLGALVAWLQPGVVPSVRRVSASAAEIDAISAAMTAETEEREVVSA